MVERERDQRHVPAESAGDVGRPRHGRGVDPDRIHPARHLDHSELLPAAHLVRARAPLLPLLLGVRLPRCPAAVTSRLAALGLRQRHAEAPDTQSLCAAGGAISFALLGGLRSRAHPLLGAGHRESHRVQALVDPLVEHEREMLRARCVSRLRHRLAQGRLRHQRGVRARAGKPPLRRDGAVCGAGREVGLADGRVDRDERLGSCS
mmetsp:Transcript_27940/g.80137  ORF Transcript_27940/g.80137 Transcript_27940/m.80137 type:complete len:206 (+) Transcript_27940:540-1157(+)